MKFGTTAFLVAILITALHGQSESLKPMLASSILSYPVGYRISQVDGHEVSSINDSFTIVVFSIGKESKTVEIALVRKSPVGDASDLRSFRAEIKADLNYQITPEADTFTLHGTSQ